jgi:hypothetical protein
MVLTKRNHIWQDQSIQRIIHARIRSTAIIPFHVRQELKETGGDNVAGHTMAGKRKPENRLEETNSHDSKESQAEDDGKTSVHRYERSKTGCDTPTTKRDLKSARRGPRDWYRSVETMFVSKSDDRIVEIYEPS